MVPANGEKPGSSPMGAAGFLADFENSHHPEQIESEKTAVEFCQLSGAFADSFPEEVLSPTRHLPVALKKSAATPGLFPFAGATCWAATRGGRLPRQTRKLD